MTPPTVSTSRTYLRIGAAVYPVYGDDVRGWSLCADDFGAVLAATPWVYGSIDEIFFALVNLVNADPSHSRGSRTQGS